MQQIDRAFCQEEEREKKKIREREKNADFGIHIINIRCLWVLFIAGSW